MAANSSESSESASDPAEPQETGSLHAVVLGATGACGRHVLLQLLENPRFSRVRVISRRSVVPLINTENHADFQALHPKFEELLFDDLDNVTPAAFSAAPSSSSSSTPSSSSDPEVPADVVFCGLGTTLKNAGSKDRFMAIDHDLLVALAGKAKEAHVPTFSYISASGANEDSWFFYNKVKGLNEHHLADLGFPSLLVYRPSLLVTPREESRPGERFAQAVMPCFDWMLPNSVKSITVETVARSMISTFLSSRETLTESPQVRFIENDVIHQTGRIH